MLSHTKDTEKLVSNSRIFMAVLKITLESFTPIVGSETAALHLNTFKLHFRHLNGKLFLQKLTPCPRGIDGNCWQT